MPQSLAHNPSDTFASSKAAQVARLFVLKNGGKISKMKLIKLLYLTERSSIQRRTRPMFYDTYFSMPHGPICSAALDKLKPASVWNGLLEGRTNAEIKATAKEPDYDELSRSDKRIIDDVWNNFGCMTALQLSDWTHKNCGEYKAVPKHTCEPITLQDIANEVNANQEILRSNIIEHRLFDLATR